jgi:hypothetical protein
VSFIDNGNGTATISGTPAAGSAGSYPITITASNGVDPAAAQEFTADVLAPGSAIPISPSSLTQRPLGAAGALNGTGSRHR